VAVVVEVYVELLDIEKVVYTIANTVQEVAVFSCKLYLLKRFQLQIICELCCTLFRYRGTWH